MTANQSLYGMNFITYNLILLGAGFPALFLFSVGVMGILAPLALFSKSGEPPKVVLFPLMGLAGLFQVYFWGLWAAFCVATTYRFTDKPEVTWDWLYFISGFMCFTSLIGWLSHKERQAGGTGKAFEYGTIFYALIAQVAYIVFAIWPPVMLTPYGWALELLGLEGYVR